MTKKATIIKLCRIQFRAANHLGWNFAADCFCNDNLDNYQNEGKALDFIDAAVNEKLNETKKNRK